MGFSEILFKFYVIKSVFCRFRIEIIKITAKLSIFSGKEIKNAIREFYKLNNKSSVKIAS